MKPGQWFAVIFGVLFYFGILAFFIRAAVKWGKKTLSTKTDSMDAVLATAGARKVAVIPNQGVGLYRGTEVEYELGKHRVYTNAYYINRSYVRVNVRVATGGPLPTVVVFPEGAVDRFGKAIGLNREVQTGDKAFDDAAYIDTVDTDEVTSRLFTRPELREAVRDVLTFGYKVEFSRAGVSAFQVVYGMKNVDATHVATVAAAVGRIAEQVPGFTESELKKSSFKLPALGVVTVLISIFGIGAAVGMGGLTHTNLDGGSAALLVLGGGGTLWLVWCGLLLVFLRGRSYAFRTLLFLSLFSLLGMPAFGGVLLVFLNEKLDAAAPTQVTATVKSVHHKKDVHKVHFLSWTDATAIERVYVPHAEIDAYKPGDVAVIQIHPGALGVPWLEVTGKSNPVAAP